MSSTLADTAPSKSGFAQSSCFVPVSKQAHAHIYTELPPPHILFPYEISASQMSHVRVDLYQTMHYIPYGVLSFIYYSNYIRGWIVVEVNRFRKISSVWKICFSVPPFNGQSTPPTCFFKPPVPQIFMGIHLFPESGDPVFVLTRRITFDALTNIANTVNMTILPEECNGWPYPCMLPLSDVVEYSLQTHLIDIVLKMPYPIHHVQFKPTDTSIPNTVLRIRDIVDSECDDKCNAERNGEKDDNAAKPLDSRPRTLNPDITHGHTEIFRVRAGDKQDIFYLYARRELPHSSNDRHKEKELCYYDELYIPNLEQSQWLNSVFRNVQIPDTYDWIEGCDKNNKKKGEKGKKCTIENYKQLDTTFRTMRCMFHSKFQRWVPVEMVSGNTRPVEEGKLPPSGELPFEPTLLYGR